MLTAALILWTWRPWLGEVQCFSFLIFSPQRRWRHHTWSLSQFQMCPTNITPQVCTHMTRSQMLFCCCWPSIGAKQLWRGDKSWWRQLHSTLQQVHSLPIPVSNNTCQITMSHTRWEMSWWPEDHTWYVQWWGPTAQGKRSWCGFEHLPFSIVLYISERSSNIWSNDTQMKLAGTNHYILFQYEMNPTFVMKRSRVHWPAFSRLYISTSNTMDSFNMTVNLYGHYIPRKLWVGSSYYVSVLYLCYCANLLQLLYALRLRGK